MTHRLIYNPHLHTSRLFLSLLEAGLSDPNALPPLGIDLPKHLPQPPQFVPATEETAKMQEMLSRPFAVPTEMPSAGSSRGNEALTQIVNRTSTIENSPAPPGLASPLILLNANASDLLPLRRWPVNRYAELARRLLLAFPQAQVVFTGGPGEAPTAEALVAEVGSARCFSLAGKTTMRQLLVLFTLADVLVTNDSGPAHFATLTPVQVVTLFGPETPQLFAALTPRNRALWAGFPCSPCVSAYNNRQSPCRDNLCMKAISVDKVLAAVRQAVEAVVGQASRLPEERPALAGDNAAQTPPTAGETLRGQLPR
jgi:hypothetical protein